MTSEVLLIGHGSPDAGSQAELRELRRLLQEALGITVTIGVLEFPGPGLPTVEAALAALDGAGWPGRVAAQPLLLFEGMHWALDLPLLAARAGDALGVELALGTPLGTEPALLDLVVSRLRACGCGPGDRLLLVGRGSSQAAACRQTEAVAEAIGQRLAIGHDVCYTGISQPDLAAGMRLALASSPARVLVVPYLLHTGILARRAAEVLRPLARDAGCSLVVLPHLGNTPVLVELLAERIRLLLTAPLKTHHQTTHPGGFLPADNTAEAGGWQARPLRSGAADRDLRP